MGTNKNARTPRRRTHFEQIPVAAIKADPERRPQMTTQTILVEPAPGKVALHIRPAGPRVGKHS